MAPQAAASAELHVGPEGLTGQENELTLNGLCGLRFPEGLPENETIFAHCAQVTAVPVALHRRLEVHPPPEGEPTR